MHVQTYPLRLALLGVRLSRHRVGSLALFLLLWLPITEDQIVLNLTIANTAKRLCTARVFDLHERQRTSVDYAVMLGMPVPPVPTLN